MTGPGRIERLAGEVALKAIVLAAKRAQARGDVHEMAHLVAMTLYGNSQHNDLAPCPLPDNFGQVRREYSASFAASRAARDAAGRRRYVRSWLAWCTRVGRPAGGSDAR